MSNSSLCRSAALAAVLFSHAALADPFGFKGVLLGSHVGRIASNPKYECRPVRTPSADRICGLRKDETETIAGAPVDSLFYFYDQSALTGITIHLGEKHFQAVVQALKDKYGTAERKTEAVRTISGQAAENVTYTWRQPGQAMVAQRFAGRIDKSSLRISDETAPARIKQRREQITRQPQRDI